MWLQYGDKGPKVKELQKLLNNNKYFHPKKKIVVDGKFGSLTAGLVQRTKYFLGYVKDDIHPVAGDHLLGILTNKITLSAEEKQRRAVRLKQYEERQKQATEQDRRRIRALGIIKEELGTMEAPINSNHIKYTTWWGWGPCAYCVIGISWAWVKAGSKAFVRGSRWASTDVMLNDAKMGHNGIHLTHDPDPGDPGVIDFDGHANPDHAITFIKDNRNGTCQTYEFNTTKNGIGGVWNQNRQYKNCWWFEVEK